MKIAPPKKLFIALRMKVIVSYSCLCVKERQFCIFHIQFDGFCKSEMNKGFGQNSDDISQCAESMQKSVLGSTYVLTYN